MKTIEESISGVSRIITVPSREDDEAMNRFYAEETKALLKSIGRDEARRMFRYEECEVDAEYVGFIENYADLSNLPKDITVVDIGSYMSFQGDYFKNHKGYIGVEPSVPLEYRLTQKNATYYQMTGQRFMNEVLPKLIEDGLDLDRTFCVCSAVPDRELYKQIAETFPYHRVAYPARETIEHYPFDAPDTIKRHNEDKGIMETAEKTGSFRKGTAKERE